MPPIIFAVQKDDDEETVRVCVDGKQRLTSIQKFLDGLVRDHVSTGLSFLLIDLVRFLVSLTRHVSQRSALNAFMSRSRSAHKKELLVREI